MEALNDVYQKKYFYPLSYTIEANMSGVDLEKARALHAQGGRLTALQDVDYATKGVGTDEDALRSRIGGMTKSEIDQLAAEWARTHNGEDLRKVLESELSGRDAEDILDMYDEGAPESAKARVAQEKRRVERELGPLTGVLGGVAAGNEAALLREELAFLEELSGDLDRRDLSDEKRELLQDQLDFRVELVQQGVEDHRRAIDSVANFAAQAASMVVAVAVGAALTFFSGGTLGPVMIAVIASVAATVTTMGTKALIQGGSYGVEDIGVDLAVGVVDALTAAATAGMGGKLLRGAAGASEQAAARAAQPNRFMRFLGKAGGSEVMQGVAKSRAGQVAGKVASSLNQMESGFLTRGIKGTNILARMAQGDNRALRILADGLAEGIENAVSALPSSFAGTALNDKTWEGNPLLNLAAGTYEGVKGAVQLGAVMKGVHGVKDAHVKAVEHARLATPEGRLREANRILNEAHEQHRAKNPGATHQDFMNSPEAHHAKAEIEQRGLIGEQRQLAKAGDPAAPKAEPARPDATAKVEPKPEATPHPEAKTEPAQRAAADGASERCRAGRERRSAERASRQGGRSRDAGLARRTAEIAHRPCRRAGERQGRGQFGPRHSRSAWTGSRRARRGRPARHADRCAAARPHHPKHAAISGTARQTAAAEGLVPSHYRRVGGLGGQTRARETAGHHPRAHAAAVRGRPDAGSPYQTGRRDQSSQWADRQIPESY